MSEALANPSPVEFVSATPRYPIADYTHAAAEITAIHDLDDNGVYVGIGWLVYQENTEALNLLSDRGIAEYPEAYIWHHLRDSAAAGVPAKQARDEILAAVAHGDPETRYLPDFLAEIRPSQVAKAPYHS